MRETDKIGDDDEWYLSGCCVWQQGSWMYTGKVPVNRLRYKKGRWSQANLSVGDLAYIYLTQILTSCTHIRSLECLEGNVFCRITNKVGGRPVPGWRMYF